MLFLRIDALGILSTNKFKYHVSCLLSASYVRTYPHLKLHQERITTCNQKRSLRNYSRDIRDAPHSSKTKVGSCQNHPTRPEAGKKPIKSKHLPFPTRSHQGHWEFLGGKWRDYERNAFLKKPKWAATTAQLAQKTQNHQDPMKNPALADPHKPLTVLWREICRKEPVMKMMVEHCFAGSPKEIEGII